jgi:hypothetical protein
MVPTVETDGCFKYKKASMPVVRGLCFIVLDYPVKGGNNPRNFALSNRLMQEGYRITSPRTYPLKSG